MRKIDIYRNAYTPYGVYGMLSIDGNPTCLTAERPWRFNKKSISCIPHGKYKATRETYVSKSGANYESYLLDNVPGRTRIFLHKGNDPMQDSEGCILLGLGLSGYLDGTHIVNSEKAFNILMSFSKEDHIEINIHPNPLYEKKIIQPKNAIRISKEMVFQEKELKKIKPVAKPEIKINLIDRILYLWHEYSDDLGQVVKMVGSITALSNPVLGGAVLGVGNILAVPDDSPTKKGEKTSQGIAWDKVINWIIKTIKRLLKKEA